MIRDIIQTISTMSETAMGAIADIVEYIDCQKNEIFISPLLYLNYA